MTKSKKINKQKYKMGMETGCKRNKKRTNLNLMRFCYYHCILKIIGY